MSIIFIYNYLFIYSISLFCTWILPLTFLSFPSLLKTQRNSYLVVLCLIMFSYWFPAVVQFYFVANSGDVKLTFQFCRLLIYLSTFAKPLSIYLVGLFTFERLLTKFVLKYFSNVVVYRQFGRKLFNLTLVLCSISIGVFRFYDVFYSVLQSKPMNSTNDEQYANNDQDVPDLISNTTNQIISFQFCFDTLDINDYRRLLSFYVIEYIGEYLILFFTIAMLLVILLQQICLSRVNDRSRFDWSWNTKLYVILAVSVVGSELFLLFFHLIVDGVNFSNNNTQLTSLQFMLFIYLIRCVVLPISVVIVFSDSLKRFVIDFFCFARSSGKELNEDDRISMSASFQIGQTSINN